MRNSFKREFSSFTYIKTTIVFGLTSFLISMLLHILFTYLYFHYDPLLLYLSFTHKDKTTKSSVRLRPFFTAEDQHFNTAMTNPKFRSGKHHVVPQSSLGTLKPSPGHYTVSSDPLQ